MSGLFPVHQEIRLLQCPHCNETFRHAFAVSNWNCSLEVTELKQEISRLRIYIKKLNGIKYGGIKP